MHFVKILLLCTFIVFFLKKKQALDFNNIFSLSDIAWWDYVLCKA